MSGKPVGTSAVMRRWSILTCSITSHRSTTNTTGPESDYTRVSPPSSTSSDHEAGGRSGCFPQIRPTAPPPISTTCLIHSTLGKWWKMGHRYGFWRTKVVLRHPSRLRWVEWLPWVGVLATAAAYGAGSPLWWLGGALYAAVLFAEGLRNARSGASFLLGVPFCLMMLHASFSVGLIDGFLRRGRPASDR